MILALWVFCFYILTHCLTPDYIQYLYTFIYLFVFIPIAELVKMCNAKRNHTKPKKDTMYFVPDQRMQTQDFPGVRTPENWWCHISWPPSWPATWLVGQRYYIVFSGSLASSKFKFFQIRSQETTPKFPASSYFLFRWRLCLKLEFLAPPPYINNVILVKRVHTAVVSGGRTCNVRWWKEWLSKLGP